VVVISIRITILTMSSRSQSSCRTKHSFALHRCSLATCSAGIIDTSCAFPRSMHNMP
jgi:hypothetical protein